MRKTASSDFLKTFYKLLSHAGLGNTVASPKTRHISRLVLKEKAKIVSFKPSFVSINIINRDVVPLQPSNTSIAWDKSTLNETSVLISHNLIWIKSLLRKKLREDDWMSVACQDTDFLLSRIETADLYLNVANFAHLLEFSEYPKNHQLNERQNRMKLSLGNGRWA